MTLCCCKIPCNIPCKVDPLYINLFSKLVKNHSIIFSLQTKDLLILKILLQLFQFSDINNFYKSMLLCMFVLNISWVFFFREKNKGYSKFKWSHAIHYWQQKSVKNPTSTTFCRRFCKNWSTVPQASSLIIWQNISKTHEIKF